MNSDIEHCVHNSPLCSTHEHTALEGHYVESNPDILVHLFQNYVLDDLLSAGARREDLDALIDARRPDIRGRFRAVERAWNATRETGYGEAVRLAAERVFQLTEMTPESLARADSEHPLRGKPGERLWLLKDVANLDHVQIDTASRPLPPEAIGQDFFHYDLNLFDFCNGTPDLIRLAEVVDAGDIPTLEAAELALEEIVGTSAKYAVAIKSQHAYGRPLTWSVRTRSEAAKAFGELRQRGDDISAPARMCLGDWFIGRIAELAATHNLPFKIHTGYFAGNNRMDFNNIRIDGLCTLLRSNPHTRFVLMHIAYPYSDEVIALAKHFQCVSIDMCWAWSINPLHAATFLSRLLHSVPSKKVFVFGGDADRPVATVGYALQARRWLSKVLRAEVVEECLSEKRAVALAQFWMMENPYDFYDVASKKAALRSAIATEEAKFAVFSKLERVVNYRR